MDALARLQSIAGTFSWPLPPAQSLLAVQVIFVAGTRRWREGFHPVKGAPGGDEYHQLWIDPADPQRRILGVDQGALVTLDGGASWISWYNQPTGQFYHVIGVATDGHDPGGLSHWHAARFEALRAGRPAADVDFLRCGREVQC